MEQLAMAAFLIVHGLVHVAVWGMPKPAESSPPFEPTHSWALAAGHVSPASQRTTTITLAWLAAVLFAAAGAALTVGVGAWTSLALLAAGAGLVLKALCFNRWLTAGVALDVAVLIAATTPWPAT